MYTVFSRTTTKKGNRRWYNQKANRGFKTQVKKYSINLKEDRKGETEERKG